jgi:hypothetical protein
MDIFSQLVTAEILTQSEADAIKADMQKGPGRKSSIHRFFN